MRLGYRRARVSLLKISGSRISKLMLFIRQDVAIQWHCTPSLEYGDDLLLHGGGTEAVKRSHTCPHPVRFHVGRGGWPSEGNENSVFQNSNFALINAISVTVIMDQINGWPKQLLCLCVMMGSCRELFGHFVLMGEVSSAVVLYK